MTFEFMVLEVIPYLFIGVPVRGVAGKVEDMETRLAINERYGFL